MIAAKKWAVAASFGAMMSVQGGASIAKTLFHLVGPAGAVTLRIGLAGILLALIHRPEFWKFTRKEWGYALFYGLSTSAMNLTFYYGIQRVPLGLGVTVEFIGPLTLAFLTSRKFLDFLWASLAGIGIFLIMPLHHENVDPLGLFFVFLAGVFWAFYIVSGSKITRNMKNSDAVTSGMCIGTFLVLPFGLYSGDLTHLNGMMLLMGFGVAVFSSALPFTLDLLAMKRLPSKTFSVLQSLQPAFGAFSGLLFLGEMLSPRQWAAVLCVVLASMGTTLLAGNLAEKS